MQCHVCGTEVRPEHKFCMECGARLHRSSDLALAPPRAEDDTTGRMRALPSPHSHRMFDPVTGQLLAVPPPPPLPPPDDDATNVLPAIGQPMNTLGPAAFSPPDVSARGPGHWDHVPDEAPLWPEEQYTVPVGPPTSGQPPYRSDYGAEYHDATRRVPVTYTPWEAAPWEGEAADRAAVAPQAFRLRPLLFLTILAAAAAAVGMVVRVLDDAQGGWKLNDFGTNQTVAGALIALTMVLGALAWCGGFRWGAGLAGGAGAGLAGWAIMVIGLAEGLVTDDVPGSEVTRDIGYWALAGAGGMGLVVLLVSLARAGDDRRAGLDPWVAALGAMAAIAAVVGPLIPVNDADLDLNWSSLPGEDLPTLYFAARFAQLGLLLFCGVLGFLLVRRYGLGLAIGGTIGAGWLVLTTETEQTDSPVGLAVMNPGSDDGKPHIVTMVGVGLILFFGLVATAMALIDDR